MEIRPFRVEVVLDVVRNVELEVAAGNLVVVGAAAVGAAVVGVAADVAAAVASPSFAVDVAADDTTVVVAVVVAVVVVAAAVAAADFADLFIEKFFTLAKWMLLLYQLTDQYSCWLQVSYRAVELVQSGPYPAVGVEPAAIVGYFA